MYYTVIIYTVIYTELLSSELLPLFDTLRFEEKVKSYGNPTGNRTWKFQVRTWLPSAQRKKNIGIFLADVSCLSVSLEDVICTLLAISW